MRASLAKNTFLLVLAQAIRVVAQALFIILVRRRLGTMGFGDFAVAFVLSKLITQLAELGFSTTLLRDVSREPSELRGVISAALGLRSLTSLAVGAILVVVAFLLPYPKAVAVATVLFGVSYLAQSFSQLFFAALRSHERVQYEPAALLIYAGALLAGAGWVVRRGGGLEMLAGVALIAQLAALLWIASAGAVVLRGQIGFLLALKPLKRFWTSSWPIGLGGIGYLVYYQADTILLYFLRGDYETGVYSTAYQLVSVSLILPVSYFTALMPRLVAALQANRTEARRLLRLSSRWMLSLGLPLAIGTGAVAPKLLAFLFPDAAVESVLPLQLLIWLAAISYFGQTFTHAALVIQGARIYMRLSVLGGIVNTVANLLVIPRWGYLGACATTLGTELLINGLFFALVNRKVGRIPLLQPLWRPLAASLVMLAGLWLIGDWPLLPQIAAGAAMYAVALLALGGRTQLLSS